MPRVIFDPTQAVTFSTAQPGTYPFRIDEVKGPLKSKEKGEAMLEVYFRFVDDRLHQKHGRVIRNYMLEGKGAGFTVDLWKKVTGESIDLSQPGEIDTDDLIGKEITCELGNEDYQGELRNRIEKVIG